MEPGLPWRYLLVDMDGTLLNSRGEITPRSRAALGRAVQAGLELVLASGRTYPSLLRVGEPLGLPFHLISNGGAVGLTPRVEAVSYTNCLAAAAWPEIAEALLAEGLSVLVFSHRHPGPPLFYVASLQGHPHFEAYIGRHHALCRVADNLPGAPIPAVVEVAALGSGAQFEAASARVMARLEDRSRNHSMVLFLNRNFGKITEFFHPATSKWAAFQGMFPEAVRRPQSVIAIGDEANDLDMIAGAGLGIAMGNATNELKAVADLVTGDNDADGLADALEPLLNGDGGLVSQG
ncbi:MAG: HAD hydrolase family protein [SAR324 cluster bacterium]|nr:HAD hydrolase family protein [SAR324 cluster bacterium]